MTQDLENRIAAMEAKLQTLETFLPALLSRFEQSEAKVEAKLVQSTQEARQDRKELEAQMREGRRAAFYFGVGTIIALLTLAAAVYFGFQNLAPGA